MALNSWYGTNLAFSYLHALCLLWGPCLLVALIYDVNCASTLRAPLKAFNGAQGIKNCQLLYFSLDLSHATFLSFFGSELQNAIAHSIIHGFAWKLSCRILHLYPNCLYHKTIQYYIIPVSCFWHLEGNFQGQTALPTVIFHRLFQNFACTCYWMVFRCSKLIVHLTCQSDLWQLLHWDDLGTTQGQG